MILKRMLHVIDASTVIADPVEAEADVETVPPLPEPSPFFRPPGGFCRQFSHLNLLRLDPLDVVVSVAHLLSLLLAGKHHIWLYFREGW